MTKKHSLPKEYLPFQELVVCSNKFQGGNIILEVYQNVALLVGQGDHPSVWLSVPFSKGRTLTPLINNNQSRLEDLTIVYPKNATIILLGKTVLLHAEQLSDQKAEIVELDLRPVGLNVHGDKGGLYIGTNVLVDNTFANIPVMISIAE